MEKQRTQTVHFAGGILLKWQEVVKLFQVRGPLCLQEYIVDMRTVRLRTIKFEMKGS